MSQAESLYTRSTELTADSVEGHPFLPRTFAVGTYHVDQDNREEAVAAQAAAQDPDDRDPTASVSPDYTRRGTVTLLQAGERGQEAQSTILDVQHTPAVLDMKWVKIPDQTEARLSVADATSHVRLFDLASDSKPALKPQTSWRLNPRGALCLSLDWAQGMMVVSQSDGTLAWLPSAQAASDPSVPLPPPVSRSSSGEQDEDDEEADDPDEVQAHAQLNDPASWAAPAPVDHVGADLRPVAESGSMPRGLETWNAHDNEAWIAAFDRWSEGRVIWSGADDLTLKGWDVRTPNGRTGRRPTFVTQRGFDGGVTCLASHPARQHIWAVGSYDGYVRLFDGRMPARPLRIQGEPAQVDAEGGIWRLKWHPSDPQRLLVGGMHGGFKVLDCHALSDEEGPEPLEVLKRFDGHESIAYGCDWDRGSAHAGTDTDAETLICSVSFYDARLHLWRA